MMKKLLLLPILLISFLSSYGQFWQPQNNFEVQMIRAQKALSIPVRDTSLRMPYDNRDSIGAFIHGFDDRVYERGLFGWRGLAFTNDTYYNDRVWLGLNGASTYLRGASGTNFATDDNVTEVRVRGNNISLKAITQNTGLSNLWTISPNGTSITGTAPFSVTANNGVTQSRFQVTGDSTRIAAPLISLQGNLRLISGFSGVGKVLTDTSGNGDIAWRASNTGSVTSVGLSLPSIFSVTGSPVTSSGTLTATFATGQTANQVLATPNGTTGAVALRALVAADIPSGIASSKITWSGTTGTILRGDGTAGNAVAGNFSTSGGRITATNTSSDQLRAAYDGSNYMGITVGSTGNTTFGLAGTSPTFTFPQAGSFSSGITSNGLTLNVGSDAKYDIPYRDSATGKITRLAAGTYGQTLMSSFGGKPVYSSDIFPRHIVGNSSGPTVTIGSDFTGNASVIGNDIAGTVTVTITSSTTYPTLAAYFQLNYNTTYTTTPTVVFTPANSSTALLSGIYLKLPTSSSFQVASSGSGTSPGSATYVWNYHVIQ